MAGGHVFRNLCIALGVALVGIGAWRAAGGAELPVLAASVRQMWEKMEGQSDRNSADTATPQEKVKTYTLNTQQLDSFCATQPGGFSVYIRDLTSGQVYTYAAEKEYYPASLLKIPFALWLCRLAEAGTLDLSGELCNLYMGQLSDTTLAAYNDVGAVPVWTAMHAMIADSDNLAMRMLAAVWPATQDTGFQTFLGELGYHLPDSCSITMEDGIAGVMSVADAGRTMEALYDYFETGTDTAQKLRQCFLDAGHTALYIPDGVSAAKKYGSWDYAFHDLAIVYADHPYILCCMTDQGDAEVDFPAAPVAAMQTLGQMVCEQLNPA